jgi:predicted Kef-type K+ transport protein
VAAGPLGDAWASARRSAPSWPASRWHRHEYREAIARALVSLRDFLLLFFFIDLGAQLDLLPLGAQLGRALVLSLFVLVGNPLIVMAIMGYMGYRRRTGFLAGLTVAQISEFSLILAALGLTLGHIDRETWA